MIKKTFSILFAFLLCSSFHSVYAEKARFLSDFNQTRVFPIPNQYLIPADTYGGTFNLNKDENSLLFTDIVQDNLLFFVIQDTETGYIEDTNNTVSKFFGPVYATNFSIHNLSPEHCYSIRLSSIINETQASGCVFAEMSTDENVDSPPRYSIINTNDITEHSEELLTRAELACMIRSKLPKWRPIKDYSSVNIGENRIFSDVPSDYYAWKEIKSLVELGFLNGMGNQLFMPEQICTNIEAITALVRMLYYTPYAEKNGGYPNGYWQEGVNLGLVRAEQDMAQQINRQAFAQMLEKAANTPILLLKKAYIGGTHVYEQQENCTYNILWNQERNY